SAPEPTPTPAPAPVEIAPAESVEMLLQQPAAPTLERRVTEPKLVAWEGEKPQSVDVVEKSNGRLSRSKIEQARRTVQPLIMRRIDLAAAVSLPRKELVRQLEGLVGELLGEQRVQLNRAEQDDLV